ncbi:MAG TPA: hypothetical protein PLP89_08695, partial [Synergistales bacterium]|nr:hypothetical protein [Synergistales bacterium]
AWILSLASFSTRKGPPSTKAVFGEQFQSTALFVRHSIFWNTEKPPILQIGGFSVQQTRELARSLQRLYAPVQRLVQLRSFRLRVSPL